MKNARHITYFKHRTVSLNKVFIYVKEDLVSRTTVFSPCVLVLHVLRQKRELYFEKLCRNCLFSPSLT